MLTVKAVGLDNFQNAVGEMQREVSDWRPAWQEFEPMLHQIETEQFGSQGARGGVQWRPLTQAYGKWKAMHYPGKPLLVLSGALKDSLTGGGGPYAIRDVQPLSITLGSSHPAAIPHQRGTRRMPARLVIVLTPSDRNRLTSKMLQRLRTVSSQAGFQTVEQAGLE